MNARAAQIAAIVALALASGCSTTFKEIGIPPLMSDPGPDVAEATTQRVDAMAPRPVSAYSTWDDRSADFFIGRRAVSVGDILTVQVELNDKAVFSNKSDRSRMAGKDLGLSGSYDVNGVGGAAAASGGLTSSSDFAGSGGTVRSESMKMAIAAIVTAVLPNGNLVISGTQEIRVNAELRVLTITGIVRISDIGPNNTIDYERIAEARVSYGGRGRLSEVQQPGWGQQVLDVISPL